MSIMAEKLNKMFPTTKNKNNFIVMSILTFGITKESMATFLNINVEELLTTYIYPSSFCESVERRWHHISNSQEEALTNFSDLILALYQAFINRDVKAFKERISKITDKAAKNLIDNRKNGDKISDSDILTILKYQIKYALSAGKTASLFRIDRTNYLKRVSKILETYPEYEEAYKTLATANQKLNFNNVVTVSEGRK